MENGILRRTIQHCAGRDRKEFKHFREFLFRNNGGTVRRTESGPRSFQPGRIRDFPCPAEVKRRKEEQRAAELEALKKRVTTGDFVWLKIGYTVRKLKVTGVTDESIYAGNMKFSIKALDDALFTEEPGKEGDAE